MRKTGLNVPSRASAVGELNNLPDTFTSQPLAEFSRIADGGEIQSDAGDFQKEVHYDFHGGMFTKRWDIENGYLQMPTMEYGQAAAHEGQQSILEDEGAVSVPVGGSFTGAIDTTGDTDDIRVFLVAGQTYLVSLRGTGATKLSDPFLQVYNPTNGLVAFDDDGGIGTNSFMTITASVTGNYTIRAASFANPGDPGLGTYTVDVRVQGVDSVGDTNATAVVLNLGTTFNFRETATVSGGADLDRYEVQLEAGHFYTFNVAGGYDGSMTTGELDTILRLRNAAGTLLVQNDDVGTSDFSSGLGFLAETTGTYYLDVTGYAGAAETGGYILQFDDVDYKNMDPLDAIDWTNAKNIDTVLVNGQPTAYIYFGAAGENFGQSNFAASHGWNATEKAAVMSALLEYTKITGIQYVETADINQAEFRVNTVSGNNLGYGAYFFAQAPNYGAAQGVGMFNVNNAGWDKPGVSTQDIPGNQVSLDKGGFNYGVILHEFGHAHGLSHPHDNGGGSPTMVGVFGPATYGIFNLNQGVYTVMSYNDGWDFHPDGPSPLFIQTVGFGWSGTLSAFDIARLQERYGTHAYATGDNVYTLAGIQGPGVYYETIWDTGGNDTIAYNGGVGNAHIDLTAATIDYSPTGGGVLSFVDRVPGSTSGGGSNNNGPFGGFTIAKGVVIENATGSTGNDTLLGNAADNTLTGNAGNDTIMGRGGNDLLDGGDGTDTMTGGAGNDTFIVGEAGDVVNEAAGEGTDKVIASVTYALTAGSHVEQMETINAALTSAIGLTGNALTQTITGNAGDNVLDSGGGGDTLIGLGGNDQYFVRSTTDKVTEAAGQGNDRVLSEVNWTLGAGQHIEILSTTNFAGVNQVNLTGNELAQTIYGNAGRNFLDGNGGGDHLEGRGGNDVYIVRTAADRVYESAGEGSDELISYVSYILNAGSHVDVMLTADAASTAALDLSGNELGQTIYGNAGVNTLDGGGGGDVLRGLGGNDLYAVRNAIDQVHEAAGQGNDRVFAHTSWTLTAGSSIETLSTINAAANTAINLKGNELNQTIFGNEGANRLDGGGGTDTLEGRGGADVFAFTSAFGSGVTTVADFLFGTDKLGVAGISQAQLAAGAFRFGAAAQDADDRIMYDSATGRLFYDGDGNGAGGAIHFATIQAGLNLTANDFVTI